MFLSAVSLLLTFTTTFNSDLNAREAEAWHRLQKSVITIMHYGAPTGCAALISPEGLFVAHRNAVSQGLVNAVFSTGQELHLHQVGQDSMTRWVLLEAENWTPDLGTVLRIPFNDALPRGNVFVVIPEGPIRASFERINVAGFVQATRRALPLSEIRFEAPVNTWGGAPVISASGELLGLLGATLTLPGQSQASAPSGLLNPPVISQLSAPGQSLHSASPLPSGHLHEAGERMGPSRLSIGYAAGTPVVRRVLLGFMAPDHRVAYPSLGILCQDDAAGGAHVQSVQVGSAASIAGIRAGDVVIGIGPIPVRNSIDYALSVLHQEIGSHITIHLRRDGALLRQEVIVGREELSESMPASSRLQRSL